MGENTLPVIALKFIGLTIESSATFFGAGGLVYGVHELSGDAINTIEALPNWLGLKPDNNQEIVITRQQVFNKLTFYTKIGGLFVLAIGLKKAGVLISSETTIGTITSFLSRK